MIHSIIFDNLFFSNYKEYFSPSECYQGHQFFHIVLKNNSVYKDIRNYFL